MSGVDGSHGDQPEGERRPRPTLLVVDDERALRALVVFLLEDAGYGVLSADDGAHAITVAEGHLGQIDLLITDVSMPGMSGFELAQRLRARRSELEVLFISGYDEGLPAAVGGGGVKLLVKPFVPDQLVATVAEMLAGTGGASATV